MLLFLVHSCHSITISFIKKINLIGFKLTRYLAPKNCVNLSSYHLYSHSHYFHPSLLNNHFHLLPHHLLPLLCNLNYYLLIHYFRNCQNFLTTCSIYFNFLSAAKNHSSLGAKYKKDYYFLHSYSNFITRYQTFAFIWYSNSTKSIIIILLFHPTLTNSEFHLLSSPGHQINSIKLKSLYYFLTLFSSAKDRYDFFFF